jgi:hypothetical protein
VQIWRSFALTTAGVALLAATVLTQDAALSQRKQFGAERDELYLPRPSALKAMALGHHELVADLVFIRAIIYFGTQFQGRRDYRWLENYLDTIVNLDPKWRTPYKWAGVSTMYDGRTITNESVMQSSHFLTLGVNQFPDDWELPWMLGCNYLFELKTDDPVQRAEWRRIGGEYVRHAALVGGGPQWLPLLAATILRQEGDEQAAMKHLEEVYYSTSDENTRQEVRNRLLSLHAKIDFAEAERNRAEFERAWQATVPYAPADFFVAVGAAPSARLDWRALDRHAAIDLPTPE